MSSVSIICPGIISSGPFDVVGVTNPSPSTVISSALIPLAVVYARSPPINAVSKLSALSSLEPSLVLLRIVTISTGGLFCPEIEFSSKKVLYPISFSNVNVSVVPSPIIGAINACLLTRLSTEVELSYSLSSTLTSLI